MQRIDSKQPHHVLEYSQTLPQVILIQQPLNSKKCTSKTCIPNYVKIDIISKWISDVREVAQDSEDVIDAFALKIDIPRRRGGLLRWCIFFPKRTIYLCKFGKEIESIRGRLQEIGQRRVTYGIQSIGETRSRGRSDAAIERRRQIFPWELEKHVVGLEEDVKTLLQKAIFTEKEGRSMASIVGMGGVGKSTLAKKVYNHVDIAERFEFRAWITVSESFRPKELMETILKKLVSNKDDRDKMKEASEEDLMEMVNQRLTGKRYFIVVDDVWQHQDCDYLAKAFSDDQDKKSRVLITSRITNISKGADYVHEMKGLDPDKSWQLFLKTALNNNDNAKCPPELEHIGKEILEKCNGLPLAIIVMGGLLLEQGQTVSGWEKIRKGITSYSSASKDSVHAVLELSYWDLPPHLQSCFMCLSFTREDENISASNLVQIWVAEGIVPHGEGEETMEERARSYFDELINRNMIQAVELFEDGQVKLCRVHDLLLELSIKKAKEEMRFHVVMEEGSSKDLVKARHVAIYGSKEGFMLWRCPNPHVRSLFYRRVGHLNGGKSDTSGHNWKSFKGLRVLELRGLGLEKLPNTIGKMIELRYLGLSSNGIQRLPKSLGYLKNLQTLDINENDEVIVPNVLWKLDSLRHLYMPLNITCKEPLKLDALKNLQTFDCGWTKNIQVAHLKQLINLRELVASITEDTAIMMNDALSTLKNLVTLSLTWRDDYAVSIDGIADLKHLARLTIDGQLTKLPSHLPKSLLEMSLSNTKLKEGSIPVLETLPELLSLELGTGACHDLDMVVRDSGFPSLRTFSLWAMYRLCRIQLGHNAMPNLKRLVCINLELLPQKEELRLMAQLQVLRIYDPTGRTKSRFEGDEYSTIISKIPDFEFIFDFIPPIDA